MRPGSRCIGALRILRRPHGAEDAPLALEPVLIAVDRDDRDIARGEFAVLQDFGSRVLAPVNPPAARLTFLGARHKINPVLGRALVFIAPDGRPVLEEEQGSWLGDAIEIFRDPDRILLIPLEQIPGPGVLDIDGLGARELAFKEFLGSLVVTKANSASEPSSSVE